MGMENESNDMNMNQQINEANGNQAPIIIERHEQESESSKLKKTLIAVGAITAGVCGFYCAVKIHGLCKGLDMSFTELTKATKVDISDKMVEKATRHAAEAAAEKVAKRAAEEISADVSKSIKEQVGEAIKNSYSSIKGKVIQEVKDQVSRMSIDDLREEIKDDAKELIQEKLEADMNDILHDYNKQLESVGKIYDSIASKLSASTDTASGKNINLKLG